jgi:hypothetical protein
MAYEEKMLALLEHGRIEAEHTEASRQARYLKEDDIRLLLRAQEDVAVAVGASDRLAAEDALKAAIIARDAPEEGTREAVYAARISYLESLVESIVRKNEAADQAEASAAKKKGG